MRSGRAAHLAGRGLSVADRGLSWAARHPVVARAGDRVVGAVEALSQQAEASCRPRTVYQMRVPRPFPYRPRSEVRAMRPEADLDGIAAISMDVFGWHPASAGYDRDGLAARVARPGFDPGLVLVHEVDGRVAGYCWGEVEASDDPVAYLRDLAVHPDLGGRGIGRDLFVASCADLETRTRHPVRFYVDAGNIRAARLYVDCGCVVWRVEHDWRTPWVTVTEPLEP